MERKSSSAGPCSSRGIVSEDPLTITGACGVSWDRDEMEGGWAGGGGVSDGRTAGCCKGLAAHGKPESATATRTQVRQSLMSRQTRRRPECKWPSPLPNPQRGIKQDTPFAAPQNKKTTSVRLTGRPFRIAVVSAFRMGATFLAIFARSWAFDFLMNDCISWCDSEGNSTGIELGESPLLAKYARNGAPGLASPIPSSPHQSWSTAGCCP